MMPWVEQFDYFVCFGIDTRQIRAFVNITINTRESEIIESIGTAVLFGYDVLDV